jgi:hypothetical protein
VGGAKGFILMSREERVDRSIAHGIVNQATTVIIRARAASTMIAHSVTQIANGTRFRCMFGQIKRGEVFCTTQKASERGSPHVSIGSGMPIAIKAGGTGERKASAGSQAGRSGENFARQQTQVRGVFSVHAQRLAIWRFALHSTRRAGRVGL